jgi:enoyl-CoA hydratase/carnithine racemase
VSHPPSLHCLDLQLQDGIAVLSLNRPEKRNAISFEMLRELIVCAGYLRKDRSVRVIVIRGTGESFSSGIDLSDLGDPRNRWFGFWQLVKPGRNLFQKANLIWQQMPVPVIAVLHGHCFGAGMQLALAADQRIATPDCQLSIREGQWGLVPDMGLTRSLRGLVQLDVAKELTFSARIIDG